MTATDDALQRVGEALGLLAGEISDSPIGAGSTAQGWRRTLAMCQSELEAQSAELTRLRGMVEWQSIRTAPKDGTMILGMLQDTEVPQAVYYGNAKRNDNPRGRRCWRIGWDHAVLESHDEPLHWMPLPEPPAALASRNGGGG